MKREVKELYLRFRERLLRPFVRSAPGKIDLEDDARILVIRLDRIGDLTLTTPLFRALKESYPTSTIDALVRKNTVAILDGNPHVSRIVVFEGILDTVRTLKGKYSLIVDPVMSYALKTAMLTRMLQPRFSVGFDISGRGAFFTHPVPYADDWRHFVHQTLGVLKPLGEHPRAETPAPELFAGDSAAGSVGASFFAIHPGGFYPSQRWPARNFGTMTSMLLDRYKDPSATVYLFGTPAEAEIIDSIIRSLSAPHRARVIPLLGQSLSLTIRIIKLSRIFIGNNSGLLHIACALKTPTVSLMGPTVPHLWWPFGDPKTNIVLRRGMECSPCNGDCAVNRCLTEIAPEEVFSAVESILENANR